MSLFSKAETQYLKGNKKISKSYEYKIKSIIKRKISTLLDKELPLLYHLVPNLDLTEFSKIFNNSELNNNATNLTKNSKSNDFYTNYIKNSKCDDKRYQNYIVQNKCVKINNNLPQSKYFIVVKAFGGI